jgi:hypothetical protein
MSEPAKKRDNSGALWKNTRKKQENHPDFTGECLINGREYWLSGWARESQKGNRYTSLAFKPKEPKPGYQAPKSQYPVNTTQKPKEPDDEGPGGDMPW